jgi:stage II sporulation protein AA (anti-sigma F factor antagonist)
LDHQGSVKGVTPLPHVTDTCRFDIEAQLELDRVVLRIAGEVDLAVVPDLDRAVRDLHGTGFRHVVVDLSAVSFMDSAGLEWLLDATREAQRSGRALSLIDGSPAVSRLLDLTGMRKQFAWAQVA